MFKEKSTTRLCAFVLAAAFALAPAGCGGGGGGGGGTTAAPPDPPAPVDPGPTPEEIEAQALKEARDAAVAAWMAAMAAVRGAVDPVAMGNAQVYADMAGEASGAAATAGTSATAGAYRAAAEGHRDSAVEAAGARGLGLTSLANRIANQNAVDNASLEGRPAVEPVSNAGRVGAELAATATATGDSAVVHTEATGSVSQGGEVSATAQFGASGPAITVTGVGATGLLRGEAPALLTTRGGWMGRELAEDAASDSYANVYTDIEAPGMRQNYGATADGSGTGPDDAALAIGQIITGDVPGDGSTFTGTRNVSPTDNLPPQAGRFHCAPGTVGGCAISVDEDGRVVAVTGYGWQPVASGMTPVPDADYLAWGVWLSVPDAAGAMDPAAAGAFASGSDVFEVRAGLTGTATYNGVATGVYSAGGMVEYFDADVSLTASFGGTGGADSTPETGNAGENDGLLLGAVTGSVSRIRAGGMSVAGSLTLGRAPVIAGARDGDSTTGFEGVSRGALGGASLKGTWGGQFYGPNDAAADTDAARTEYPTTAAGAFAAAAAGSATDPDPIRILGSFAAWRAE